MKFVVHAEVFQQLPGVCFGVVVARNVNGEQGAAMASRLLADNITWAENLFDGRKAKESEEIAPYRHAFVQLGINPNKFMSSIEAIATRLEKKKGFPSINPVVDIGNAVSLRHIVPLGAHDMDQAAGDICVRPSAAGDLFIPFGETEAEEVPPGELIYTAGGQVKTRRWIWRQSEHGKVTADSRNIFFPIDGFAGHNLDRVLAAREELADKLRQYFGAQVLTGLVDQDHPEMEI